MRIKNFDMRHLISIIKKQDSLLQDVKNILIKVRKENEIHKNTEKWLEVYEKFESENK